MKCQDTRQPRPVPRLRLYLAAIVLVPVFMGFMAAMTAVSVFVILRSHTRLVQVPAGGAAAEWQSLGELPGTPEQLAVSADGTLWARTQMWGSLARWRSGSWEVFRHDTFGTRRSSPRHDFSVVGNRLWAAIDDKLVYFDGQRWQGQPIPQAAADHVLAASGKAVWVLGNDGVLRTWDHAKWEVAGLRATIADAAWDSDKPFDAPSLVAAHDGSLWLCAKTVWRGANGAWAPVKSANTPLGNVELLGHAGAKLWFRDGLDLLWVAESAASSGRFGGGQGGLPSNGPIDAVCELGGDVCAAGAGGIYVLTAGRWDLKWPAPEGVARCQTAVAASGRIYAIAFYLTPIPALWLGVPIAAVLSGAALWGIRRFLSPKGSLLGMLSRRHLITLALVVALAGVGALSETSGPILLLFAPVAAAILILLVPPLVMLGIVFRDFTGRCLEIIRLRPVSADEMPAAARKWFERHTPDFESLGFRPVGDFRLKERSEHFARVFINAEGDAIGEISWAKPLPWQSMRCCCFVSVMEDLTYLETGNLALPRETFEGPLILFSVPKASVADVHAAHRRRLAELMEDRRTTTLCFGPEDVEKVFLYGQKLCYARLKKRGVIRSNPYDDVSLDLAGREASDAPAGRGSGIPPLDSVGDWHSPTPVG